MEKVTINREAAEVLMKLSGTDMILMVEAVLQYTFDETEPTLTHFAGKEILLFMWEKIVKPNLELQKEV